MLMNEILHVPIIAWLAVASIGVGTVVVYAFQRVTKRARTGRARRQWHYFLPTALEDRGR